MKEHYDKEAAEVKKAQSKSSSGNTVIDSDGKIKTPEHLKNVSSKLPSYTTKASKK
jgi:hypothetical protein